MPLRPRAQDRFASVLTLGGPNQSGLAALIHRVNRESVLGKVDADECDGHDFSSRRWWMERNASLGIKTADMYTQTDRRPRRGNSHGNSAALRQAPEQCPPSAGCTRSKDVRLHACLTLRQAYDRRLQPAWLQPKIPHRENPMRYTRLCQLPLAALLAATAASLPAVATTAPTSGFITAPTRADVAYDSSRSVLYISGSDSLLRFDMFTQSFMAPIYLGGSTLGMDISPDGSTLAVANRSRGATRNFIDLINLATGTSSRVGFDLAFGEGGTFTVAYDSAGKLLVSSQFEGSGWVPLRKYDPLSGQSSTVGSVRQNSMLSASADNSAIAIAESNISNGPYGVYRTGNTSYASNRSLGWFTFEIGVSRNGQQVAIPTYNGTYIDDASTVIPSIGAYAGQTPIGVAYSPNSDTMYFPFAQSNFIAAYSTATGQELQRFAVPGTFDWTGNVAFSEGRTKIADDATYLFSTLDNGIYFLSLSPVPELPAWLLLTAGLVFARTRSTARRAGAGEA